MTIYCKVEAFYKVEATKLKKEYWSEIYDPSDIIEYTKQGYEAKMKLSIIAIDGNLEQVLNSRDFVPTSNSQHNISFLGTTFMYDSRTGDIVCLNKYINI